MPASTPCGRRSDGPIPSDHHFVNEQTMSNRIPNGTSNSVPDRFPSGQCSGRNSGRHVFAAMLVAIAIGSASAQDHAHDQGPDEGSEHGHAARDAYAVETAAQSSGAAGSTGAAGQDAARRSGRPPIRLEPSNIDLGFLPPKTVGSAVFTLTNISDEPLTILNVAPTCRCTTTADHVGAVIEPGEAYELEVLLDAAIAPQARSASVRVLFDGYPRTIDLAVRGEIANPVRTLPGWINAEEGIATKGRLMVESIDEAPFRICSVHGFPVRYVGFDPETDEPKNRYMIEYDLSDFESTGLPGWMIIETDHPVFPVVDVRVRATARDFGVGIRGIRDFRVPMGRISPGGVGETTIEFANLQRIPEFVGAVSLVDNAEVEFVKQEGDLERLLVTVRLRPRDGFRGLLYTPIQLRTADASQDVVLFATVTDGACVPPTPRQDGGESPE